MIPFDIWEVLLALSVLGTYYTWKIIDKQNYTDIITGLFATILWILSGYSFFLGIYINDTTAYFNTPVGLLFVFFGIVLGLFTFMRILNFVNPSKEEGIKDGFNFDD